MDKASQEEIRPLVSPSAPTLSKTWDVFKVVFAAIMMVGVVGVGPGFPGIRQVVLDEHVFLSKCGTENVGTCPHQANALEGSVALSFILLNFCAVFVGMVRDYLGDNRLFGTLSACVWMAAFGLMGFAPESGIVFAICFLIANFSACGVFFTFLLDLVPAISPPNWEGKLRAILTGFWDLGAITFVILAQVYGTFRPPLWKLFGVYGVVAGLLCTAFVYFSTPATTQTTTQGENIRIAWYEVLGIRFYWVSVLNSVIPIAYGYLWISLVVNHMEWKGATEEEARSYNETFAWMLPVFGTIASLYAGLTINFQNSATLRKAYLVQAGLIFGVGVFAVVPGLKFQYGAFLLLILCRMYGFAIANSSVPTIYCYTPMIGRWTGLNFTIGGLIGVGLEQLAINAVTHNPQNFFLVHVLFCTFGVVVALIGAGRVRRDLSNECQSLELLELMRSSYIEIDGSTLP